MEWITRSATKNLSRMIRRAGERGDLRVLDEIKQELKILDKVWEGAMEEAVMRGSSGPEEDKE